MQWKQRVQKKQRMQIKEKQKRNENEEEENKPGREIRCDSQAEIIVFGGFSLIRTDGRTDTPS